MEEDKKIPLIAYEIAQMKYERTTKRLIVALIIAVVLMFASNALWWVAWTGYDYTSERSITVDAKDGIANYIGNDGDIVNGSDSSEIRETQD